MTKKRTKNNKKSLFSLLAICVAFLIAILLIVAKNPIVTKNVATSDSSSDSASSSDYPAVTMSERWDTPKIVNAVMAYRQSLDDSTLSSEQFEIIHEMEAKSAELVRQQAALSPELTDVIVLVNDSKGNSILPSFYSEMSKTNVQAMNSSPLLVPKALAASNQASDNSQYARGRIIKINGTLTVDKLNLLISTTLPEKIVIDNQRITAVDKTYLTNLFGPSLQDPEIKILIDLNNDAAFSALLTMRLDAIKANVAGLSYVLGGYDLITLPALYSKFDLDGAFAFHDNIKSTVRTDFKDGYSQIQAVYGPRPTYNLLWDSDYDSYQDKIKVVIDDSAPIACYSPYLNSIKLQKIALTLRPAFVHETVHAFHGIFIPIVPELWEEGAATALTEEILGYDKLTGYLYNDRVIKGFQTYETSVFPDRSFDELEPGLYTKDLFGGISYKIGSAFLQKIYIENKGFLADLNKQIYTLGNTVLAQASKNAAIDYFSGKSKISNKDLEKMVVSILPTVEGVDTKQWLLKQYFLTPINLITGLAAGTTQTRLNSFQVEGRLNDTNDFSPYKHVYSNFNSIFHKKFSDLTIRNVAKWPYREIFSFNLSFYGFESGKYLDFGNYKRDLSALDSANQTELLLSGRLGNVPDNYQGLLKVNVSLAGINGEKFSFDQYFVKIDSDTEHAFYGEVINGQDYDSVTKFGDFADISGKELVSSTVKNNKDITFVNQPDFSISDIPVKNGLFISNDPRLKYAGKYTVRIRRNVLSCDSGVCVMSEKVVATRVVNKIETESFVMAMNAAECNCCYEAIPKLNPTSTELQMTKKAACGNTCTQILTGSDGFATNRCIGDSCLFYNISAVAKPWTVYLFDTAGRDLGKVLDPIK